MREALISRLRPGRAPAATAPAPVLFDEALLGQLRRLALVAGRARTDGIVGEHRSRRRGSSPEFADFKSYSPGDDYRRIDWSTYGRLDELFIRVSEVTTELNLHILIDASASMAWPGESAGPDKFTYARRLAGALGYIALWHGDRLTVSSFAADLGPAFGPVQGRPQILPLLRHLTVLPPLGETSFATSIERYVTGRRRPGLMVIISDLLTSDPAELSAVLRSLRIRHWDVTLLHVLSEPEIDPAGARRYLTDDAAGLAPLELIDAESGLRLRLTPDDAVFARYATAVAAWLAEVEAICLAEQTTYARLLTDWRIDTVVLGLLHARGVVA